MNWFDVDRQGLAAILERRGKFFAIAELLANAWDSGTARVEVSLQPVEGQPYATLIVDDWGEGFKNLDDAFTMFAPSSRGGDPSKRGRFNLGEKLALSVCRTAEIETTSGTLIFDSGGRRHRSAGRAKGTRFIGDLRMTREELHECRQKIHWLIPPVPTTFNGDPLEQPTMVTSFEVKLPTECAGDDGMLRRYVKNTVVEVYEDEPGDILEMGVPVVETDNGYRVNVMQKIPLNMERDNVTTAFLRAVQSALLNHVHNRLTPEQAVSPWVQEAAGDARATPEAVKAVVVKRFGERAVVATPGDVMANANAEAAGYTVIPGGAMSGDMWSNVKKAQILLPAGQVFPTAKPEQLAAMASEKCPMCGK